METNLKEMSCFGTDEHFFFLRNVTIQFQKPSANDQLEFSPIHITLNYVINTGDELADVGIMSWVCIPEVLWSNLGRDTGYLLRAFRDFFSLSRQILDSALIRSLSKSFPIHHSL
jgi:hypothetical protein